MTALFEQAYKDPVLKRKLLHEPRAVAEKFKVEFKPDEIEHLQKLGALMDLADEIKTGRLYPRPPIFYPMHVFQIQEILEIVARIIPGGFHPGPISYRAEPMAFFRPGWNGYPPDDPGGGGGGVVSGWHIPGPIYYPAHLLNFMRESLEEILQVQGY